MALIKCPHCGKEISGQAAYCPGCGSPLNSNYSSVPSDGQPSSGEVNGLAIASLVLGIVGLLSLCTKFSLIPSILGLALGCLARSNKTAGRGMANAGIILSTIALALRLAFWFLMAVLGVSILGSIWSLL